jgi:predicted phosphodiesterase
MNRRQFLALSSAGLLDLLWSSRAEAKALNLSKEDYNIIILGDTHFDTEPASVYHSHYNEKVEWLNRVQRAEFKRNGEMWRERCPRLVSRAAELMDDKTRMVFQMGDLIQGDCGDPEVHKKMLDDVMNRFKTEFGGRPFVTVAGNHDIRGTGAEKAYHEYMPARMSRELDEPITKTTFSFHIGPDAFIVIDFNTPDDAEIERQLAATAGARHTFILTHGPVFPSDDSSCRWFLHGGADPKNTEARRHFRQEFARRQAIVLCGHTHNTEFADWYGDGGRITQMTMNSVWAADELGTYTVEAQGAKQYGELRKNIPAADDESKLKDETPLFDEYRSGLKRYSFSPAAGSYKMTVGKKHITIDFYAGDSRNISHTFKVR